MAVCQGSSVTANIEGMLVVPGKGVGIQASRSVEGNHTDRFWNIVRANNPNSDKAKRWLKEHGQVLEEEL